MNPRVLLMCVTCASLIFSAVAAAADKEPTTRSVTEKNGLSLTVQLPKATFADGEDLGFDVTFANISQKPFKLLNADWLGDWKIILAPDGGGGPWQATWVPKEAALKMTTTTVRLDPGQAHILPVTIDPATFEYRWIGESFAPVKPLKHLRPGHYTLTITLRLGSTDDNSSIPYWSGQIETKPVDVNIVPGN